MRSPSTANQTGVATGRASRRRGVKLIYANLPNSPTTWPLTLGAYIGAGLKLWFKLLCLTMKLKTVRFSGKRLLLVLGGVAVLMTFVAIFGLQSVDRPGSGISQSVAI